MKRAFWLPLLAAALAFMITTSARADQYVGPSEPRTSAAVPGGLGGDPPGFGTNPSAGYPPYSPLATPFPPNDQIAREAGLGPTVVSRIPGIAGASAVSITNENIYVISGGTLSKYDMNLNLVEQVALPAATGPSAQLVPSEVGPGPAWVALLTGLNAQGYTYGKGFAYVWMDPNGQLLHYLVNLTNVDNVTGVYIHYLLGNLPDVAAPAVAPLYIGQTITSPFTGTLAVGTISADNLINMMAERPIGNLLLAIVQHRAIITVHTTQRPQGELMGKLVPVFRGTT